jgi:hypothetical protein
MLRMCERFWFVSEALALGLTTFGCFDSGSAGGAAGSSAASASTTGATTSATSGSAGSAGSSTSSVGSGGAGGAGGGGLTTGGGAGTGGAGGQPCVIGGDPRPMSLPFAMDQYFVSSGWMQPALIQQATTCAYPPGPLVADDAGASDASGVDAASPPDASSMPPRPALPGTKCWSITYTPLLAADWAGVDWQYPANNWGTGDGLVIPPGATKVSLVAWGDVGGEKVSFNVGYGPTSTDGFGASLADRFLTTTPTPYAIDITGIAYTCTSVRMGFGWIAAGGTKITFHIADIRWE